MILVVDNTSDIIKIVEIHNQINKKIIKLLDNML